MSLKSERELRLEMQQDEAREKFQEIIKKLETQIEQLSIAGVEAEESGNVETQEIIYASITSIDNQLQAMKQMKVNIDVATLTAGASSVMMEAMGVVSKMAGSKYALPNMKKVLKTQEKVAKYMANISSSQKMMSKVMNKANPSSRATLSQQEKSNARLRIEAQRVKMGKGLSGIQSDLKNEIEAEKSKPII